MNPKVLANLERFKKLPPRKYEVVEEPFKDEDNPHGYELDDNGHIIDDDNEDECPYGYCIGVDCIHFRDGEDNEDDCAIDGLGHIIDDDNEDECPHGYCIGADCPHLVTSLSGIDSCDIDGLDNEKYEHDINGFE